VFLYSIVYFSRLESNMFVTYLLYFGYMGVISLGVFLVTGELLSPRLLVHLSPLLVHKLIYCTVLPQARSASSPACTSTTRSTAPSRSTKPSRGS
jgi:hypothetical protein